MISCEAPSKSIRCVQYELRSFRFGRGSIFSQYLVHFTTSKPWTCSIMWYGTVEISSIWYSDRHFQKKTKKSVTWANIAFTCNALLPAYSLPFLAWTLSWQIGYRSVIVMVVVSEGKFARNLRKHLFLQLLRRWHAKGQLRSGHEQWQLVEVIIFCGGSYRFAVFCACPETNLTPQR